MMPMNRYFTWCVALIAGVTFLTVIGPDSAAGQDSPKDQEAKLIAVLRSDAPAAEKAITCKRLAVYGTETAVPALAPLLTDEHLTSWARIALEVIPGPATDAALRDAMGKAQGRVLIGVINSIGVRRDAQAVPALAEKLKDANVEVASAAAVALGCIGGDPAAKVLEQALADASPAVRPAVAEGCVRCAQRYLTDGKAAEAKKLYDAVCLADVPKQRILEATRGAILARGSTGVSYLIEQLRSADKGRLGIGLRTARELPGRDVTEALATAMGGLSADRRPLLLLALADRTDDAVLPAVVKAAKDGSKDLRVAAVGVMTRIGNVSCVPVLLEAAADSDAELAQAAKTTLTKLPGKDVDADLLARLPQASGKTRQVLIELAGWRQIEGSLGAVLPAIKDADAGIRSAAVQALGILGGPRQVVDLVALAQKTQDSKERADVEKALLAVSGRSGATCVPDLLPLMQSSDGTLRMVGLHAMAIVGGPAALAAVKDGTQDKDETVQDEAVRTLSTWPNNWPEDTAAADALLTLAKSGKKVSHQVLGLRGYLQYLRGEKTLAADKKVDKVKDLLGQIQRPEEKRLAVSVLGGIPAGGAFDLLTKLVADPAVAEETCSAMLNLVGREIPGVSKEQRQTILRTIVEKSQNARTKRRAEEMLRSL
ncbi:MAG: HEAT repeat domain-containing protein [Phycisphaerae bacterium]|nr:HEAT repeat domain-containing protein [Phycisphaerae bacterium]